MKSFNSDAVMPLLEAALRDAVYQVSDEAGLSEAMLYSLMAGGKRLRPMLLLASASMCGVDIEKAMPFAAALEMIHTYSLIHDDLPAMDNDDYRRGRLTSHRMFGEGQAILAGDALLNGAAELMTGACLSWESPAPALRAMDRILSASGGRGMIRGQWIDLKATGGDIDGESLETMHMNKTGALFQAALEGGALLADADPQTVGCLHAYAVAFGMAFQMTDDILDVIGDAGKVGKTLGKDAEEHKCTYVTLYGLDETRRLAAEWCRRAEKALKPCEGEEKDWLLQLIRGMLERDH